MRCNSSHTTTEVNLRYWVVQLVRCHAKRRPSPTRLNGEGERLTDWQLWHSPGNGHHFGHMKLAGDSVC